MKIIVAKDLDGAIGKDNELPWRLSWDMKNFRRTTMGSTVLMGRKTFESIGRPLPGRRNLVMTKDCDLKIEGCEMVYDFYDTLSKNPDMFVIGGAQLYAIALPLVQELYLTIVKTHIQGADAYFPNVDMYDWITTGYESFAKDANNEYSGTFYKMIRQ